MKRAIKLISFLLVVSISSPGMANGAASSTKIKLDNEKKQNAKCYVQLVGGGEAISLWLVKPSLLKNLKRKIVGQEILVIQTQKKANIYRAKECILEEDDFKDTRALAMDKELPR